MIDEAIMRYRSIVLAGLVLALSVNLAHGQGQGGRGGGGGQGRGGQGRGQAAPVRPAPRFPDGQINLGQVPGEPAGLWDAGPTNIPLARPDTATDFGLFAADAREPADPFMAAKPKLSQIPFQPWARALFDYRVTIRNEPYVRCKPSSGARQVGTAYGTQFVDDREQKRFYIFETGGAHSFRTVFMDGQPHPANLSPTNRGHSVGHWEGDTLVVDTVALREDTLLDLFSPHSDQLTVHERIRFTSRGILEDRITATDPKALLEPFTQIRTYRKASPPNDELREFSCAEGLSSVK